MIVGLAHEEIPGRWMDLALPVKGLGCQKAVLDNGASSPSRGCGAPATLLGIETVMCCDLEHPKMARGKSESAPKVIAADDNIADVVAWFPATEDALNRFGLTGLKHGSFSRIMARHVTVAEAAHAVGAELQDVLDALRDAGPGAE